MRKTGLLLSLAIILLSCGGRPSLPPTPPADQVRRDDAEKSEISSLVTVRLQPTPGNTVSGTVVFTPVEKDGVRVTADITGLTLGDHGFHIHERGDCSGTDADSAGGHFNPAGMPHAGPETLPHHTGDLGNLTADASGMAHLDRTYAFLAMEGAGGIVGRSVVVHAGKDDLVSQPAGNSGRPIACGVIQRNP